MAYLPTNDITTSGSIAALNATVVLNLNGQSAATAQVTGTWVATLQFEGTLDGTNWIPINAVAASTSGPTPVTTVNGLYRITPAGLTTFRINTTAYTSGTAVITMRASSGVGGTFINQIAPIKITNGTDTVTIKPASVASVATDTALVVAISPNNVVPVLINTGSNTIGKVAIDQTINIVAATTMQNAAVAIGNGTNLNVQGYTSALINITGTMATNTAVTFEASVDDVTFVSIAGHQIGIAGNMLSTTTNIGDFRFNIAGYKSLRARVSVFGTGSVTAKGYVSTLAGHSTTVNANIIASIPTGTNTIGAVNIAAGQMIGSTQVDTNITGTISATDILAPIPAGNGILITTAPTTNSFISALVPGGSAQADIQITGTATGTYYFEGSMDSTTGSDGNWIAVNYRQTGITNTVLGFSAIAVGVYRGAPSGFKYIRVRNVGGTTPSNPIIFRYSNGGGTTFLNASIPSGSNVIGIVTLATGTTINTVNTVSAVTAITNALPTGANVIGKVSIDQTSPGTTNLVNIGTNGVVSLNAGTNRIGLVAIDQATDGVSNKVQSFQQAITKGTQGTLGITTQDLKDAGRNQVHYYTLIPVLSTATDTLQSLTGTSLGASVAATTTPALVTAGKTFRITRLAASYISTATSGYAIVRLRFNNASAAATITSPIAATILVGSGAPTTANSTASEEATLDEGWEFPQRAGVAISVQGFAGVTPTAVGYVLVSMTGYEY